MELKTNTSEGELALEEILPSINNEGIKELNNLAENNDNKKLETFFNKLKSLHHDLESSINEEKLAKEAIKTFAAIGSLFINIKNKNTMAKQEKTVKQEEKFKVGQLVSTPFRKDFLKGKIKEVLDDKLVIEHFKKGDITIPKDNTIVMYPGQRLDVREVAPLFPIGGVEYKDIQKSELLSKLLKGKETGPQNIEYLNKDKEITKETVRFRIIKENGKPKIKVLRPYKNGIVYGKAVTPNELKDLKDGKSVVATRVNKTTGEEFKMVMYYDKELNGIRSKAINKNPLEQGKVKIYGKELTKDQVNQLNSGKTIKVPREDKDGNSLSYTVSYNKDLDKLNVAKGVLTKKEKVKVVKTKTTTKKRGMKI